MVSRWREPPGACDDTRNVPGLLRGGGKSPIRGQDFLSIFLLGHFLPVLKETQQGASTAGAGRGPDYSKVDRGSDT